MTDKHFIVYNCVCSRLSMSKAAEELNISQPAVSRYIRDLEAYYKTVLFRRSKIGLTLTESGKTLFAYSQMIIANMESVERKLNITEDRRAFRIGAIPVLSETVLPRLLDRLSETFPDLEITVMVDTTDNLHHSMQNDELDIVLSDRPAVTSKTIESVFCTSPMIALAAEASDHPGEMSLPEIALCDLLLKERGSANRELVDAMFVRIGCIVKPKYESSSNTFLMEQCEKGKGLVFISEILGRYYQKRYALKAIRLTDCSMMRNFYVAHKKTLTSYEDFTTVYDMVLDELK